MKVCVSLASLIYYMYIVEGALMYLIALLSLNLHSHSLFVLSALIDSAVCLLYCSVCYENNMVRCDVIESG